MNAQTIEYTNGRTRLVGQLYRGSSGNGTRPGVVVFPEAFGLNAHARERAECLAQLGYVAFAADLLGDGRVFDDLPGVTPTIKALYADRAEWRSRAQAALDVLRAQDDVDRERLGAIGFCFGGSTALELARSGAPLSAITAFHAGLLPALAEDAGRIRCRVLICHGDEDPLLNADTMNTVFDELRRDRVDWQMVRYGNAAHSFTDRRADARKDPRFRYDARADARSWSAMRQLFDEAFARS
ncbi:dienelactone hydrolase family protein [Sinimarinibacterium thermocellulolyticum]|uniref:Dienelactone hydrolase family protein n=1 Tax=Sinimarinibacterium thermocellulolyticum TaxID=3170016 RepID=A0ABV2AAL3_9GAMM